MKTIQLPKTAPVEHQSKLQISQVSHLETSNIEEAARVLSQAFVRYPVTNYLFEGVENGQDRFRVMFEYLINSRIVRNSPVLGCHHGDKLVGVAVVSEPGEGYTNPELDAQWDHASAFMGEISMHRFEKYGDLCDETLPTWPHHYLGILGVLPQFQGKGIGRLLLETVLDEAKKHTTSRGVCLNTESERNLPFYGKSGFQVFNDIDVDSIHTWGMVWEKEE